MYLRIICFISFKLMWPGKLGLNAKTAREVLEPSSHRELRIVWCCGISLFHIHNWLLKEPQEIREKCFLVSKEGRLPVLALTIRFQTLCETIFVVVYHCAST
ncbi:hypothetical protein M758_2G044600 [Ceratodon purpureus]|nr:hypothetical protein M758_2G044300 [Ceratodon purpureus]KAG0625312.1 hypothetical protein M758_2G044600 [Ceratodon purpureus]